MNTVDSGVGDLPGLDLGALTMWAKEEGLLQPGIQLSGHLVGGGKSNLTYAVEGGPCAWVVRRPPLGAVVESAHDMSREYRVMSALADSDVPVPTMFAFCSDPTVLGAPFLVMERVNGHSYARAEQLDALGAERTRAITSEMIQVLARLGCLDPDALGLSSFGRPSGFLARQVRLWHRQMQDGRPSVRALANALHDQLQRQVPPSSTNGLVHGDFRLDNLLVADSDEIAAVIDWEMATVGDPVTDLALLLIYMKHGAKTRTAALASASAAPGFIGASETVALYEEMVGHSLAHFGFYLGLACLKLAAIAEGITTRYAAGLTVGEGYEDVGSIVVPLLEDGLSLVGRY